MVGWFCTTSAMLALNSCLNVSSAESLAILDTLKITTYVSIIIDEELGDINTALNSISGSKNILVITAKANDIEFANNYGLTSCLVYFGSEIDLAMEKGPTHVINKTSQLDSIIIE